jgi:GNAT superfamily N-acetyltransferase
MPSSTPEPPAPPARGAAPTAPHVRPYLTADLGALHDIGVRTAHEGGDARHLYPDPDLVPSIFAAPYAVLEPDLAFVLDDGSGRAVGYVLGTADTARFAEAFRDRWLPRVAARFPAPSGPPRSPSEEMALLLHRPERMVLPELADHPAHLHIDLLPGWQRRGYGRALMGAFLAALRAQGVGAVHLGMVTANTPARAFYDRLGFTELPVADPGPLTYLGRGTHPLA